ncbi:MAG TPA: hypothetical protein P5572_20540 [Phycisphaerae bacterium]|nr:hypothetical protein [Phycisphaerales bacterium]HRX87420.1 hypothetical protein [Phycisphaerae bacterium]
MTVTLALAGLLAGCAHARWDTRAVYASNCERDCICSFLQSTSAHNLAVARENRDDRCARVHTGTDREHTLLRISPPSNPCTESIVEHLYGPAPRARCR